MELILPIPRSISHSAFRVTTISTCKSSRLLARGSRYQRKALAARVVGSMALARPD